MVEENSVAFGAHKEGDVFVRAWSGSPDSFLHVEVKGLADLVQPDKFFAEAVNRFMRHEVETLEGELGARRYEAAEAQTSFHSVLGSVLRMDYKLRNHTDAQGGAVAQRDEDGDTL